MRLLYVDDQLVDLRPNTVIAQTLQAYDPGRMGSVLANYTTSIRVPITTNNKRIFQSLENSKAKSLIPYSSLTCRYVENGITLIRDGRVVVTEVGSDYSLSVYSGPWGFFKVIETAKMWDLDFSDINGPWTQEARDGYRNATSGILNALLDDGRLTQDSESDPIEYQGNIWRIPQLYYHTAIEKIFQTAGFEFIGDIFSNLIYKSLAFPLGVIYNDPRFIDDRMFYAASVPGQVIADPVTPVEVVFSYNVKQGAAGYYDGVSRYVVNNPDTSAEFFWMIFWAEVTIDVTGGGTVDITFEQTDKSIPLVQANVGSGTYLLSWTGSCKDGDEVRLVIVNNTGNPTVEVLAGKFYTSPFGGKEDEHYRASIVQTYVYFQKLFEDIKQADFLKEFCIRFGVMITQVNNVLHVNTFNKILDITSGPNWTSKRNIDLDSKKFSFANFAKSNLIKSPVDSDFTPDLTTGYGDGSFDLPNENLRDQTTIYTSIYAVTDMVSSFGVFMLKLNLGPYLTTLFERIPGNRLFFVRSRYDSEPEVLIDSANRSDYKVAYYFDPYQPYELSWQFFIDNFYQKYVDRCLRHVRLIEREYNLTDLDVYQFNPQIPVWDNGERFLVVKISNRVSGKVCRVQLLKVESNPAVTYIENRLYIELSDYMERSGEVANVSDLLEQVSMQLSNYPPTYLLRLELVENIAGSPTWQATFNNGTNSRVLTVIGDGSSNDNTIPNDSASVSANVLKTNNNGFGPDGFPMATGWVEWLKNGVRMNTATFDSSMHSSVWGLNYTFTGVVVGDVLKVVVRENGTSPT